MKTIVVIGLGALGSHFVKAGRNFKVTWKLVDFDRVEQKNTLAQEHGKMSVRENKALAFKKALSALHGVSVEAIPHKLTRENAKALLGGAALVVDCTDNIEARRVIQEFVTANGIPCVHGSLSAAGDFGRVMWTEMFVADAEGAEGQATCEDGEQLPFFFFAGALLAQEVQKFLKDGSKRSFQFSPLSVTRLA
jgi:molybdopterin/thiamine biosynthesis adenylyltransferase